MPGTHHLPSPAKHRITSKIFIVDGLRSRQPSTPSGEEDAALEHVNPSPGRLWARLRTGWRLCVSRPGRKRHFVPPLPSGAAPRSTLGWALMLRILPVLALAAAPAGFRVIENHPGRAGQGRAGSAQARREVLSQGKAEPGVSPGKVGDRCCQQPLHARGTQPGTAQLGGTRNPWLWDKSPCRCGITPASESARFPLGAASPVSIHSLPTQSLAAGNAPPKKEKTNKQTTKKTPQPKNQSNFRAL